MITVRSHKGATSFALSLRHVTVFRTQPIRFAFRAPTGRQVPIRNKCNSPFYTLLFGQRGQFHVHEKDHTFLLLPHSLLLLAPNCPFSIAAEENANSSFLAVEFDILSKDLVFDLTKHGTLYLENAKEFGILFDEIQTLTDDRYAYGEVLLLTLFEKIRRLKTEKSNTLNLYGHALSYIRRHIADPPTSTPVAFGTHYNAEHLSKLLKSSHGLSLSALIKRERLEILKNYLRFTSYTPERIASILAFPSSLAMLAFFRYHTGMTPNEYRKTLHKNSTKNERTEK